jgi:hypothetical protein
MPRTSDESAAALPIAARARGTDCGAERTLLKTVSTQLAINSRRIFDGGCAVAPVRGALQAACLFADGDWWRRVRPLSAEKLGISFADVAA